MVWKSTRGSGFTLIDHRMGSGGEDSDVSFADEPTGHLFGRLIKFNSDTAMGSHYRIKDDVIREVNRKSENGRFTISVLEVRRNEEGKYLPGVYTVSFWNKDGSLRSTTTTNETWKRVGTFDLPLTHDSVSTSANEIRNLRMEFSNYQLAETAAKLQACFLRSRNLPAERKPPAACDEPRTSMETLLASSENNSSPQAHAPRPLGGVVWTSDEILKGTREIQIVHRGETYRLPLTKNGKPILSK